MATKARLIYTADEDSLQKQRREFSIADELQQKIDSIEEGAQVNTIETIKVNGVALIPDENKAVDIEVPGVIDSLDSTSIDDALSARQGKILYEYIQNLGARGRYLSNWNCATGLPVTNPQENPYTYMTGDYFSVSNVATSPATNYRPDGTQYVAGQASQAVETDTVEVSDFYIYDGANWILLHNSSRTIAVDSSLSTTSTNPVENRVVTNAINSKADITYVDAHDTVVSSTAPSNPTQGMVWYDTTNDVLKTYDGTSWTGVGVECNTKTFYLSSTSDLTTAQAALDWYNDGKNPLIIYNNQCYIVRGVSPGHLYFGGQNAGGVQIDNIGYYNLVAQDVIELRSLSGVVQSIYVSLGNITGRFLDPTQNYTNPYIPLYPGSPATKKYVDDIISSIVIPTYVAGPGIEIGQIESYLAMQGPCDDGFHVPSKDEREDVTTMGRTMGIFGTNQRDVADYTAYLKVPAAGYLYYQNGGLTGVGNFLIYWTNTSVTGDTKAYMYGGLIAGTGGASATAWEISMGLPVRPFKDIPVEPDSTWTTLLDGSSVATGAGVFWDENEGLISISSDGQTWITLADKNIGATNVGDLGNYFQRGNNNEFVSGSVTTSSTTVDTSSYGPSEFSSNTFITAAPWSNPFNDDLWGGTTGIIQADNAIINTGVLSVNGQTGDVVVTDTTYTAGTGINIDANNEISNTLPGPIISATAPTGTEGALWYDTTNDVLKVYDGTNWHTVDTDTDTTYIAGEGIEIGDLLDYSAMQGPAPDGFHVPLTTEWNAVYNIWTALGGGIYDGPNFGIALKLPFAGDRLGSSAGVYGQGTSAYYWSSTAYTNTNGSYGLNFSSNRINSPSGYLRASGFSVRCFKNMPVIPTSSWTKLYGTSIESGGIFWSSTDGLISLSSDGQTWVTIADKNLGATAVWNSGDTLSEANCGKYYQWGNNYGFPRTGTIANQSTTQVDASNYGPGNYYSSDTFIKNSGSWENTDNRNLWGGETGVVTLNAISNTGVLSVNGQTGDVVVTDTTYSAGTGINIDANNEISNTLPGPIISATAPTGTEGALWYDTTNDVLMAYDGTSWKEAGTQMKVLSYGHSTWQDFLDAYNENAIVYCRASSQSNPGSGIQGRMAFMAFIDINSSTQAIQGVEFQYYRSRSDHNSAANQLDQVFVYKLTSAGTWTVTERNTGAKAVAGTGISLGWGSGNMTISADTSVLATKADLANFAGFEVVATLPQNPSTNIIYLKGPIGTGTDKYEEWIYSNSTWIQIGETSIDLTDYAQKSEVLVKTNTTSYTPSGDYNPATKKYVDDSISAITIPTVNDATLTVTQNGVSAGTFTANASNNTTIALTDTTYTAGDGIAILNGFNYSAMRGPCDEGYHIPSEDENTALKDTLIVLGIDTSNGNCLKTYLKMPFAGYRDSGANTTSQGSSANYWSSTPKSTSSACYLYSSSSSFTTHNGSSRSTGCSIRPFKDVSIIPDNNWTVLYQGTGGAGIFYNNTLGVISLSGDGTNWITIADKNLGATIVYSDGDTLSQANCGKYYQWGNNYGFDWAGNITTSSTQIDSTGYGPGNYYSDSTFITGGRDRSSVQNDNLRGGETGVVQLSNAITNTGVLSVNGLTGNVTVEGLTYTAGTGISINSSSVISNTGVTSVNGQVGDVLVDESTKTFYLSSTSDLTTAQDVLDWCLAGKNAIIILTTDNDGGISRGTYLFRNNSGNSLTFYQSVISENDGATHTAITNAFLQIDYSTDTVTQVRRIGPDTQYQVGVLATGCNYATPYTPEYAGSPATKKYVDDSISAITIPTYTAGTNVSIDANNVISATDTTYIAGTGINISDYADYSAMRGPAPEGYHVPSVGEFRQIRDILDDLGIDSSAINSLKTYLKLPSAGALLQYGVYFRGDDNSGFSYRACTATTNHNVQYADQLDYRNGTVYYDDNSGRGNCIPIRAFKDNPVIPNAQWTVLYDGSTIATGAGIFHSSTLGLISLSSDGQNRLTIADKNLGATVVYNNGDTLIDNNCGGYFQWGNNYMFPGVRPESIISTPIDASGYGPGNYYSSSDYYYVNNSDNDWDSTHNKNLRGGVTGIVQLQNIITNTGVLSVNGQTGHVTVQSGGGGVLIGGETLADKGTNFANYLNSINFTPNAAESIGFVGILDGRPYYLQNMYYITQDVQYRFIFELIATSSGNVSNQSSRTYHELRRIVLDYDSTSETWSYNSSDSTYIATTADKVLRIDQDYSNPYIPLYDGSPATKKYVDSKIMASSTSPSSPAEGMLWYDTTNDTLYSYDGSNWQIVGSGGGSSVQSNWTQTDSTAADYIKNKPSLATVATSGSYNDLSNKPIIPTVYNGTLTIQKNGTTVDTFTANSSSNKTVNITVPTKTSELTNNSGFITSSSIPSVGNGTITINQGGVQKGTFTTNQSGNTTINLDAGGGAERYVQGGTRCLVHSVVNNDGTAESFYIGGENRDWAMANISFFCSSSSTQFEGHIHLAPFSFSSVYKSYNSSGTNVSYDYDNDIDFSSFQRVCTIRKAGDTSKYLFVNIKTSGNKIYIESGNRLGESATFYYTVGGVYGDLTY